jgi:hypothetical protein
VHRRPRRPALGLLIAALASCALGLVWSSTGGTLASWTSAQVQDSANSAAVGSLAITHSYTGGPCATTPRSTSTSCSPTLTQQVPTPGSSSDSITNDSGATVTQSVSAASCGPVQFVNAQLGSDPMLPRYGVTFQQADKWGSTSAASFAGTGYATDIVGTTGSGLLGALQNSNSIGVWFKASDAQGGGLISLTPSRSNATSTYGDPMMWLDTSGRVHFAASGTLGPIQGTSTHAFTSGWHLAVLTVNTTGILTLTKSITLYVDAVQEATNSGLTLLTGSSGYWHVGWGDFTGLTAPTSAYFHGSLSGAFVNQSTALSAAQVSTLFSAASATAYQTAAAGQSGISSIWMLGDSGVTTYGGTLPGGEAAPCTKVTVTLTFTNPAAAIGPMTLATFADGTSRSAGNLAAGQTQGLTIATAQGAGYSNDLGGIHLYVPVTFSYGTVPASGWTVAMSWSGHPADVFWA